MAMLCRDLCRGLLPPAEYFDYGLWVPAGRFRPDSDVSDVSDDEDAAGAAGAGPAGAGPAAPPPPVIPPSAMEETMLAVAGSKNACTPDQAADVARKLGYAPSLAEIQALKDAKGASVTARDIEDWMKTCVHNDTADNLVKFFEHYDKAHTGTLTKTQMGNLLRTYGEPLTDAEFNAILNDMHMTGDKIDYRAFVAALLA